MTTLELCTELRCLGIESKLTRQGLLLKLTESDIDRVLEFIGIKAVKKQIEIDMWLIEVDKF